MSANAIDMPDMERLESQADPDQKESQCCRNMILSPAFLAFYCRCALADQRPPQDLPGRNIAYHLSLRLTLDIPALAIDCLPLVSARSSASRGPFRHGTGREAG
jgi:hypothetical protein